MASTGISRARAPARIGPMASATTTGLLKVAAILIATSWRHIDPVRISMNSVVGGTAQMRPTKTAKPWKYISTTWSLPTPVVFTDARILYLTGAHELVHARDILNRNWLEWSFEFMTTPTEVIMEHNAYQRSAAIKAGLGVDYGPADALKILAPVLPAGFNFDLYNK